MPMSDSFLKTLRDEFLSKGGRELIVQAKLEDPAVTFTTAEDLLSFITTASIKFSHVENLLAFVEHRTAANTAALKPVGDNGLPRMLKISAFIMHGGGLPNNNGDAFLDADLKEAVDAGLFGPPYFGMIDFNHDFTAYGVWYNSKFELDPATGTNGVLAEGAVFAWRYSEIADQMLAQQQRQGFMDVSMGCLPSWVEPGVTADGRSFDILRKPILFTTSLLTVPKGDLAARGMGTENPVEMHDLEQPLMHKTAKLAIEPHLSKADISNLMEVAMTIEELVEAFRKVVAEENRAQYDEIVAAALKLPTVQTELTTATAKIAELTTEKAAVETQLEEAKTSVQELETVKASLEGKLTDQSAELETLRAFKATADAAELENAKTAKWNARLAELCKTARDAFDARDEESKTKLQSRWTEYDQEEWELLRDSLNATKFNVSNQYEDMSNKEGLLPGAGGEKVVKDKIDAFISAR